MPAVSTWGHDVMRGLTHPESVAARQIRLATARTDAQAREDDFECGLRLISQDRRTLGHIVRALHGLSAALKPMAGSAEAEAQEWLDELADRIENN